MKRIVLSLLYLILSLSISNAKNVAFTISNPPDTIVNRTPFIVPPKSTSIISIIPAPQQMTVNAHSFTLKPGTKIIITDSTSIEGNFLSDFLKKATGYSFSIQSGISASKKNNIILELTTLYDSFIGEEGYYLNVTPKGVVIKANKQVGIFYGLQSFIQLLPKQIYNSSVTKGIEWTSPCVNIIDYPRFKWRGFMQDVSRHFFDVNEIKRLLDIMASLKMNIFHWHLMDDQGFRIEVKSHPELATIGSTRSANCPNENTKYDNGFYTQEQIKDVVAYALARHINIVPELETPGHSQEWLAALPGLACTNVPTQIVRCMDNAKYVRRSICVGKTYTYQVLQDVINEMTYLFPFNFVHIGGDEANHTSWKTCNDCLKLMHDSTTSALPLDTSVLGLKNLQKFHLKRIQGMFSTKGKRIVGWTEMGVENMDKSTVLQDWLGGGENAINNGYDVIFSSYYDIYLDLSRNTLSKVYNYNPISKANDNVIAKSHILGIEAASWAETVKDSIILEARAFPRLFAASEAAWSDDANEGKMKSYDEFTMRLYDRLMVLDILKYNYKALDIPAKTAPITKIVSKGNAKLNANFPADNYAWVNKKHSTSSSIIVNKSGTYKVKGSYKGELIEREFNVLILR